MIISFLKFYSSRKAQDAAEEKKKKVAAKKATEKQAAKEPIIGSVVPVPEVHLTESLG